MRNTVFYSYFCIFFAIKIVFHDGYKILGVFPSSSPSHYILGSALLKGLAAKGHKVSAITAFPHNEQIENYEEIPIPKVLESFEDVLKDIEKPGGKSLLQYYNSIMTTGSTLSEKVLEQPIVQRLLTSKNRTFDLIICEIYLNDALYGLGQHFNAPLITLSPMGSSLLSSILSGAPIPPSFVPNILLGSTDRMNFVERALNLAVLTVENIIYQLYWLPYQSKVYNKFFPNAKLTFEEVMMNVSLILLNQHFSISNPEPLLQNMVEVGGLHISRQKQLLPLEIQTFLDKAHDGAIYFSLGTNCKSSGLRMEAIEAMLRVFRSMKQRVLWKYENASLPGKSDNVLIRNWFPQNDILAHPNVKLFITHGGLLSTTEAVYHGKPLLAIPVLMDQFMNVARAVEKGYAIKLSTSQLSSDDIFKRTLTELLTDPKYSSKAKQISASYRDQPLEPLEVAIFWVEYVLRHKGAPQLLSTALNLNFFQYHSLDTIAVVYGSVVLILLLVGFSLKKFVNCIFGCKRISKRKTE
ncbi:UDP-glucosyltransferase 2-like [Eupeodes corollae]|uniref:UDP-glucosyltransferase 2-like n=1 Tax=Eupeodes corollae TaxID=290404 RepID=UPI00249156D0|nr:UDP-glucosyltransferase 2-like [Eupeodes corollae]